MNLKKWENEMIHKTRLNDMDKTGPHQRGKFDWVCQIPTYALILLTLSFAFTSYTTLRWFFQAPPVDYTITKSMAIKNAEGIASLNVLMEERNNSLEELKHYIISIQNQLNKEKALNAPATIKGAENRSNRAHGQ